MAVRQTGIGNPASFFSFQDIMMCCIGIMVLLSAVFILQLKPVIQAAAAIATQEQKKLSSITAPLHSKVESLEIKVRTAEALSARDLDSELAEKETELKKLAFNKQAAVERLNRMFAGVQEQRKTEPLDPKASTALALLDLRDALIKQLEETNQRRRLTFLIRKSDGKRTRVFEVSASRIVEAYAESKSASQLFVFSTVDEGTEYLLQRIQDAYQARDAILVALKPSGAQLYIQFEKKFEEKSRKWSDLSYGIDFIGEDKWISDEHPAAQGGG